MPAFVDSEYPTDLDNPLEKIDLFITVGEDYSGQEIDELHVRKGQVLRYLEQKGTWVLAADVRGKAGYLPAACCKLGIADGQSPGEQYFDSNGIAAYLRAESSRLQHGTAKPALCSRLSLKESLAQRIEDCSCDQSQNKTKADVDNKPTKSSTSGSGESTEILEKQAKNKTSSLHRLFHFPTKSHLESFKASCRKAAHKTIKICKPDGRRGRTYKTGEVPGKLEARSPTLSARRVGAMPAQPGQMHSNAVDSNTDQERNMAASRQGSGPNDGRKRRGYNVSFCDEGPKYHAPVAPQSKRLSTSFQDQSISYLDEKSYSPRNASLALQEDDTERIYENCDDIVLKIAGPRSLDEKSSNSFLEPSECSIAPCVARSHNGGIYQRPTSVKPRLPPGLHHSAPATRAGSPDATLCAQSRRTQTNRHRLQSVVGSLEYLQDDSTDPLAADMGTFRRHCPVNAQATSSKRYRPRHSMRLSNGAEREFAQRSFSNEIEYQPTKGAELRPAGGKLRTRNGHSVVNRTSSVPAVLQPTFIALFDFPATQKPLLSVNTGDILFHCSPEVEDENSVFCGFVRGWKYVVNSSSRKVGYVPTEILQAYRSGIVNGVSTTQL